MDNMLQEKRGDLMRVVRLKLPNGEPFELLVNDATILMFHFPTDYPWEPVDIDNASLMMKVWSRATETRSQVID